MYNSYNITGDAFVQFLYNSIWGFIGMGWVAILAALTFIVGTYLLYSYVILHCGRKAGMQREKDWMAFVPFARTIYRLETVGDPWWKMFVLGEWYVYLFLLNALIPLIARGSSGAAMAILNVLYLAGVLTMHVFHRVKFYRLFGLRPELSLMVLSFFSSFLFPIDCVIAFSNHYRPGGQRLPGPEHETRPQGDPSLTGLTGMYAGQDFPITSHGETILGRDSAYANIVIDQHADKVSRKHCAVRFDPSANQYMVTDYSSNGTFVENGPMPGDRQQLLRNAPTPLRRGTVIALGTQENRFKLN